MRYIRYLLLIVIALALLVVAMANRDPVIFRLVPQDLATFLGFAGVIQLPLFLVILGAAVGGIVLGFVWEWLREHKHRASARTGRRQVDRLSREVSQLKGREQKDEILALLEAPDAPRR